MSFSIQCPQCHTALKAEPEHIGKKANCAKCGTKFPIVAPAKAQPPFVAQKYAPHWFWRAPIKMCVSIFFLAVFTLALALGGYDKQGVWVAWIWSAFCVAWMIIYSLTTSLEITDSKSIFTKGILSQRVTEVWHKDIRNIQTFQNLFERLTGVGAVEISSAGQSDMEIRADGFVEFRQIKNTLNELKAQSG